jgi:hypothetical protein
MRRSKLRVRHLNRLEHRLDRPEPDSVIKTDGSLVLCRNFQVDPPETRLDESSESSTQKTGSQATFSVQGSNPQVLYGPPTVSIADPLNGSAYFPWAPINPSTYGQPGCPWQETFLLGDLPHETLAAGQLSKTREHVGVDLIAEAEMLRLGVRG